MTSAASQLLSIDDDWTDERILIFLGSWKCGDPLPSNVITDVNPFDIEPWNAPESFWYLCKTQDPLAARGETNAENTSYGYWKDTRCDHHILIDSQYFGKKITWEFVQQNASNDNFCWMMFEYNLKAKECETASETDTNMKSLCKVSGHYNYVPVFEDGDPLQSVLLNMVENEVGYSEESEGSMLISGEKSRSNQLDEVQPDCDFSNGDFLELKDLDDHTDSSSSSSDNSTRESLSSDEYFDSEALLRDLEKYNCPAFEETSTNSTKLPSRSSSSGSNSQQPGTSRAGRIKKLGKYFCFAS